MKSPRRGLSTAHIAGAALLLRELRWLSQTLACCNPRLILRNSAESLQHVFLAVCNPLAGTSRGRSGCLATPLICCPICRGLYYMALARASAVRVSLHPRFCSPQSTA